jgi:type I restriction enzyme S subunit
MNSELSTVPVGWVRTSIGTVVEFEYGKGLRKDTRDVTGSVPVYGSNGIVGYHSVPLMTASSIIVGRKGAIGAVHLATVPCWPIDTTYYVFPPNGIDISFLYYLLGNCNLGSLDKSTAIPGLNRDDAYKMSILLPPLPEQHRIVSKIEELFTRLDVGIEALKKIKTQLKRYRQSVLKSAFEGKLTEDWRQAHKHELEPASTFLERIKKERQKTAKSKYKEPPPPNTSDLPELPESWVWSHTSEVCSSVRDGTHDTPKYVDAGIPLVTSKNLKENGLDFTTAKNISIQDHEKISIRSGVEKGDILFAMIGTVGNPVVVRTDRIFSIKNVGLFKKNEAFVSPEYLKFWLASRVFNEILAKNKLLKGTTQRFIPLEHLRILPIPIAPLLEQHRIVEEIENRFSVDAEIEKTIDQSLKQAGRLRQSILKKAFEGKLVPQDPNDEPAAKLLERIKEERAMHLTEGRYGRKNRTRTATKQMRLM